MAPSTTKKTAQELRLELRAKQIADTRKRFEQHEIRSYGLDRWLIASPHATQDSWFDVVVLSGGYLYVGGDIDCVTFGISHARDSARVSWIGHHSTIDYVAEKARIGSQAPIDWERSAQVAILELQECEAECHTDEARKPFQTALEMLFSGGSVEEAEYYLLTEVDLCTEDFPFPLGHVYSQRLITAWAALQRAADLICGKTGT